MSRDCPARFAHDGEVFTCDWPIDADGKHPGFPHYSHVARTVWCGDEGPMATECPLCGRGRTLGEEARDDRAR